MTVAPDFLPWACEVLDGPTDVGCEQRWRVQSADGQRLVVAQLAPDLARDESIRRRWVRDAQRQQSLAVHAIAPITQLGPEPDPRAMEAEPPWRVRADVEGELLSRWLERAPVTLEEFSAVFAALADALQAIHIQGGVLRDLQPEQIVRTAAGRLILIDVGLSRVDVLSSHTASSLLLQGSTYSAPEQVATTAVDLRSDLFSMGVMMWQALTGALPFEDGPAFLRREHNLADLRTVRADVPESLDLLVRGCLSINPAKRPATAMQVGWVLRGGAATSLVEQATTTCQHCGAKLRVGQRLCLQCGRVSVRFVYAEPGEKSYGIDLLSLGEDAKQLKWLQGLLHDVSRGPIVAPEFLVGPQHLYSNEERRARIRLPARLYGGLAKDTAEQIHAMMAEQGLAVAVVSADELARSAQVAAFVPFGLMVVAAASWGLGVAALGWTCLVLAVVSLMALASRHVGRRTWITKTFPRFQLRPLPAALPASDPLVARLAALLGPKTDEPVRAAVGEMALLVQRLVDHRGSFVRDAAEFDMVTAPLEPLVASVEARVRDLERIDGELAELDEGGMVRALAAADARNDGAEKRTPIFDGLDRLRTLEDERAAVFRRLLEAQTLLTRTVELGLAQHDPAGEFDRGVAMALATLSGT